ncbi:PIN domain-containing protein [Catellatospora sp. KI3]|uniref:PIN domain-containing protein n=1 Tax=Catellatospora sp. KI3 TaxID=3041620 RepID=UPI002482BA08|nr:PIN domain-containing protein [Catellatospora sp. KI3]MDI1462798.1 PIN domain-containing protein [Catellatospora sp. KI3]
MSTRFLADTSAVIRILTGKADQIWIDAVTAGTVAICDPVELELLRDTPTNTRRPQIQRMIRQLCGRCPIPDDCWARALELQDELAITSQHSGASPVDLLVAVTAMKNRLVVLHDDRDYEVIARASELQIQRVIT